MTSQHVGSKAGGGPWEDSSLSCTWRPSSRCSSCWFPGYNPPVSLPTHSSPTQVTCVFLDSRRAGPQPKASLTRSPASSAESHGLTQEAGLTSRLPRLLFRCCWTSTFSYLKHVASFLLKSPLVFIRSLSSGQRLALWITWCRLLGLVSSNVAYPASVGRAGL